MNWSWNYDKRLIYVYDIINLKVSQHALNVEFVISIWMSYNYI